MSGNSRGCGSYSRFVSSFLIRCFYRGDILAYLGKYLSHINSAHISN